MSITGTAHRELLPVNSKDVQSTRTHELPVCPGSPGSLKSPECPVSLVYPVSNGQGLDKQIEQILKAFAAANRCTEHSTAKKRLWKLMRDLVAIEKGIGREPRNREQTRHDCDRDVLAIFHSPNRSGRTLDTARKKFSI